MIEENNNNIKEFFVDTTLLIILKKYKLLTISFIFANTTKIFCFILYKYQDKISYNRIRTYLKDEITEVTPDPSLGSGYYIRAEIIYSF